jgi:hypothetical protein
MHKHLGARLSEHSFGTALDIGGFVLADGRKIVIVHDWTRGDPQSQAFLRDLHNGACAHFATVLSPGSNAFHSNHIHVDLAMHGMTSTGPRRICKPAPRQTEPPSRKDNLPDAPDIEDDLDIAHGGPPPTQNSYATRPGPSLAAPAAPAVVARGAPPARAAAPTELHASRSPSGGTMNQDGVLVPEGDPADLDLPTSRAGR